MLEKKKNALGVNSLAIYSHPNFDDVQAVVRLVTREELEQNGWEYNSLEWDRGLAFEIVKNLGTYPIHGCHWDYYGSFTPIYSFKVKLKELL